LRRNVSSSERYRLRGLGYDGEIREIDAEIGSAKTRGRVEKGREHGHPVAAAF
jgi:hypothetical protein